MLCVNNSNLSWLNNDKSTIALETNKVTIKLFLNPSNTSKKSLMLVRGDIIENILIHK